MRLRFIAPTAAEGEPAPVQMKTEPSQIVAHNHSNQVHADGRDRVVLVKTVEQRCYRGNQDLYPGERIKTGNNKAIVNSCMLPQQPDCMSSESATVWMKRSS